MRLNPFSRRIRSPKTKTKEICVKFANSVYLDHGMRNVSGNGSAKLVALNTNNFSKVSNLLDSVLMKTFDSLLFGCVACW